MNKNILNTGVQKFIKNNCNTDIVSVLLKKPIFEGISQKELVEQLEAKKKCEKKLPTWFKTPNIYYPKKLNIEQTSSEKTAAYKSQIVTGKSLFDLTGGFGVDSYFFFKKIDTIFYSEINSDLSQIASYNFKILGAKNIKVISSDGIKFLENKKERFDWIYIDPSRRNDLKGKVFRLSDCIPNVIEHIDTLFSKSDNILLKTSPLLDISQGIEELQNVSEIHVVAVDNEVKELLWILKREYEESPLIKTINLKSIAESFDFILNSEKETVATFTEPQQYLYEPNAAILKSGAFKLIGNRFFLKKLHEHSHLYTSDELIEFPGRRFKVENVLRYNKKVLVGLNIKKANITTRNFPKRVADIRKKHKIKEGGGVYLFFTKNFEGQLIVIICSRVSNNTQNNPLVQ